MPLEFRASTMPCFALAIGLALAAGVVPAAGQTSLVTYQTEDGWTIRGTLTLPAAAAGERLPGVLLLTEPLNRLRTTYDSTIARSLPDAGMAVLRIDMRGTAGSVGRKDFVDFTMAEREGLRLDVRGAVAWLASHPSIDPRRIAIVGPGLNADHAVLEASENSAVKALVLITGTELSQRAKDFIAGRPDVPVLCLVGQDQDKRLQRVEAEPYFLSGSEQSRLLFGVQRGTNMMNRPGGLTEAMTAWLVDNLRALGTERPVTFTSSDGWKLAGTLYLPDGADAASKVPGVVFVHGYNHSSESWYPLARAAVRGGLAALTFDWRGTRRSIDPERGEVGVTMPGAEREKIPLDVKAAIDFLAAQPGVDGGRLGLVAATATNNHALRAAAADDRIRTYVGLSYYDPAPDVVRFLQATEMPLFIIASLEDVNAGEGGESLAESSRKVYRLSRSKESEFLLYDDAGRGSGMIDKKPELKGMIVRWFQEKL